MHEEIALACFSRMRVVPGILRMNVNYLCSLGPLVIYTVAQKHRIATL